MLRSPREWVRYRNEGQSFARYHCLDPSYPSRQLCHHRHWGNLRPERWTEPGDPPVDQCCATCLKMLGEFVSPAKKARILRDLQFVCSHPERTRRWVYWTEMLFEGSPHKAAFRYKRVP